MALTRNCFSEDAMNYKNALTAETDHFLGPAFLLTAEKDSSSVKGPHSFNPWPFLVIIGILPSCTPLSISAPLRTARTNAIGLLAAKLHPVNLHAKSPVSR